MSRGECVNRRHGLRFQRHIRNADCTYLKVQYSIIIVDVVSRVSVSEYCQGGRACVGVGVWADKAG